MAAKPEQQRESGFTIDLLQKPVRVVVKRLDGTQEVVRVHGGILADFDILPVIHSVNFSFEHSYPMQPLNINLREEYYEVWTLAIHG